MISRRVVSLAAGAGLLGASGWVRGQSAGALRRVGWLQFGSQTTPSPRRDAFMLGMRELGWQEGKNFEVRDAYANFDLKRADSLIGELIAWKAEVVVVGGVAIVRAAQRATQTMPIVMVYVANPVGNGFVASLANPGGNITGNTNQAEEVLAKAIELLHEVAPKARRIAILLNESNPTHTEYWAAAQRACAVLGLVALRVQANTSAQFAGAARQIAELGAQGVAVPGDPLFNAERAKLHESLMATRLPAIYSQRENAVAGGMLSYGSDINDAYRNAARFVAKILKGAKPADIPVEQPTKFYMVVNLKTAKALGITIPYSVMLRATEVIE